MSLSEQAWMVKWVFELARDSFPGCDLIFTPQTLIYSEYLDYVCYHHQSIKIELFSVNSQDYDYHIYDKEDLIKRGSFSLFVNKF